MAEPLPTCYLNGSLMPLSEARVSPLDRSFLFGDGVYEVIAARAGNPRRLAANLARLSHSLRQLRIRNPLSDRQWGGVVEQLISANGGGDIYVYLQVSRGAENGRNHAPLPEIERTVFAFASAFVPPAAWALEQGIACITAQDTRWARCDIKATALLANVLLRQLAVDANAAETILLKDGRLTEGSSSAVHVVIGQEILTPPQSREILPGTTRSVVEELADRAGIRHRAIALSEIAVRGADEIWISSAMREVLPVSTLDGEPVGTGVPGPLWRRIHDELQQYKRELSGEAW